MKTTFLIIIISVIFFTKSFSEEKNCEDIKTVKKYLECKNDPNKSLKKLNIGNYKIKYNYHSGQMRNFKKQYLQDNEIVFCVSSILKYAPFVRKIFIVTDNQVPNFKKIERIIPKNKIKIIDHKEIFEGLEDHLPTFNIRSIDAVLHRIKGLSEKYIYFNDDMFLIKETKINDWFSEDKAVLTGNWVKSLLSP